MTKDISKGTCSGPLPDVCRKWKVEFTMYNLTHLSLEIFNTTVNDSGQYKVWTRFSSSTFHPDEKTAKCVKVIHVKVEGKEGMRVIYSKVWAYFHAVVAYVTVVHAVQAFGPFLLQQ